MIRLIVTLFLLFNFASSKELININLKDLELVELIKITSQELDKSILIPQNIKGKVNFISNNALAKDKLLDILKYSLEDNGYKLVKNGSIYRIVSKNGYIEKKEQIKQIKPRVIKIKQDVKSPKTEKNSTQIVSLINVEAKSLETILKNIVSQRVYKNKPPSISIDQKGNFLIIDGKSVDVNNLVEIIRRLDIPKMQVYIKAKIVEVDDSLVEDIGIRYGILGGTLKSGNLYTFSSSLNDGEAIAIDTSSIGLQIPNVSSSLALGASLNLLNRTYALDILSQPSILCLNNTQSSIYVGETVSIQTANTTTDGGTTKNSFKREDIGLTLKVKPRISNDNKVLLEIDTILEGIKNINTISLNPDTSKKQINTKAILNNGESVIIGGLIESKNEKSIRKIPVASDIPLIGELFKNRFLNSQNKNLVIIVTPYIIPKDKDLTYVRSELTKLKGLEDKFLEDVLKNLKSKKNNIKEVNSNKTESLTREEHEERLKKLGFNL